MQSFFSNSDEFLDSIEDSIRSKQQKKYDSILLTSKRKSSLMLFVINVNDGVKEGNAQSVRYQVRNNLVRAWYSFFLPCVVRRALIPFTTQTSSLVTCPSPRSSLHGEEFKSLSGANGSPCLLGGFPASSSTEQ